MAAKGLKVGSIEVLHQPTTSVDAPDSNYGGLKPGTTVLPKGHQKTPAHRAFKENVVFDRDVEIVLRDGIKLRADVFRPEWDAKVPALIAWSPYGKSGTGFFTLDLVEGRLGVPQSKLSGYEKFEAPDPLEWVPKGYAIVNVDARGIFDSEGDVRSFGRAEARDGYDAIEAIAKLPWCSGSTALVGNSWLAIVQWFIAAERPPHLTCIAPFEGAIDFYRETLCRGGVPYLPFWGFLSVKLFGRNQQESPLAMLQQYPYMNEYWADKRANIENINIPAYVLASYSTGIHTVGSFRGYEDIKHDKKWLRVHATQEWHDLYQKDCIDDLQRFLDHYTKGIQNGWEQTPRVRLSLLQFNKPAIVNHPFPQWPIPNTTYRTLYLGSKDAQGTLLKDTSPAQSSLTYQANVPALQVDADSGELQFIYTCAKKAYMAGYSKAVLYMSCEKGTDFDVFVQLRKASADGQLLQNVNIPFEDLNVTIADQVSTVNSNKYLGPSGILRASRRAIDPALSKEHWAVHPHTQETEQKVQPKEIVKLEIGIWPTGIVFEPGEQLVLKVAGHQMVLAEFEPLRGAFAAANEGDCTVHFGGEYPSHVVIPLIEMA